MDGWFLKHEHTGSAHMECAKSVSPPPPYPEEHWHCHSSNESICLQMSHFVWIEDEAYSQTSIYKYHKKTEAETKKIILIHEIW